MGNCGFDPDPGACRAVGLAALHVHEHDLQVVGLVLQGQRGAADDAADDVVVGRQARDKGALVDGAFDAQELKDGLVLVQAGPGIGKAGGA